jgi:nudix motif 8
MSDGEPPSRFDGETLGRLRARLASLPRRRLCDDARRAAVLVPLCHVEGEASVLFTRRSETVGTHKGHVSFPGGMVDLEDPDVVTAALRELEEELGVPRSEVDVLGCHHDASAITGVHVTPVIGFLGEVSLASLTPSPHEIDEVFTLALPALVDPARRYQQDYGPRGCLQVFDAGPWPVWGLTAYILEGVLKELLGLELPAVPTRPGGPPS